MGGRKEQKCQLQVEKLEDRDAPSASGFTGILNANLAMPSQAQARIHSPVCFHAVVVTPEVGTPTVACPDGGFIPPGGDSGAYGKTTTRSSSATARGKRSVLARGLVTLRRCRG